MTDITELAQSLKAAAEKATPGQWMRSSVLFNSITNIANPMEQGNKPHVANTSEKRDAEFIALANPANVLALVEALEKAQQVDEELCKLLPPGVEYMDPPDGGDVTPLEGVRRMVADYRQRIAELKSRTVKLPKLKMLEDYLAEVAIEERKQILVGVKLEFHRACVAAGIKVEAE